MISAIRELWVWLTQHRSALWLATIAAFPQLHYIRYGARADLLVLPGLAIVMFLVVPWAGAIAHDAWGAATGTAPEDDPPIETWRARLAVALTAIAAGVVVVVALRWGYGDVPHKQMQKLWQADPTWFVTMVSLAFGTTVLAAVAGRHRLSDWGLSFGDWRWWGPLTFGVVVALAIGIPLAAWIDPSFTQFYPRHPLAKQGDVLALLQYQLAIGVYMFCWEFLFRGFMLFGFVRWLGPLGAILLQAYPFFLLHARKPETELIASWFGGIIAGWFAWRAKSCWPTAILHTVMYATMEITAFGFRFGWPGSA